MTPRNLISVLEQRDFAIPLAPAAITTNTGHETGFRLRESLSLGLPPPNNDRRYQLTHWSFISVLNSREFALPLDPAAITIPIAGYEENLYIHLALPVPMRRGDMRLLSALELIGGTTARRHHVLNDCSLVTHYPTVDRSVYAGDRLDSLENAINQPKVRVPRRISRTAFKGVALPMRYDFNAQTYQTQRRLIDNADGTYRLGIREAPPTGTASAVLSYGGRLLLQHLDNTIPVSDTKGPHAIGVQTEARSLLLHCCGDVCLGFYSTQ